MRRGWLKSGILARPTAQRLGSTPVTYALSAGVGDVGLRGLQLARINSLELGPLKLRNVPCLIKDPPLRNLPVKEAESLSPLSLGFSMIIDYQSKKITSASISRPSPRRSTCRYGCTVWRRCAAPWTAPTSRTSSWTTGGEVISISTATATSLGRPEPVRRIALKVFGSSGWDKDAFLLPGVDLAFDAIHYANFPVVVLNLDTPSALLGFQLGGIVGHKFLSRYRVGIDLEKSVLRLKQTS